MVDVYDALGGVQEVYAFQQSLQSGPLDPFLNGQVAMKIDGNWFLDAIGAYKPDMAFLVAPAPIPQRRLDAGARPVSWSGGYAFSVPRTARNPGASWALIRALALVGRGEDHGWPGQDEGVWPAVPETAWSFR